jgi:hypothetical protein
VDEVLVGVAVLVAVGAAGRINAQSATEITHPICLGGLVFERRYGLIVERRRHTL